MNENNPCEGCPLRGTSQKLKAKGKRNAKFLIVSKSPYKGRHFSDEAEEVLFSNLRAVGLKEDDFVIASSVRCNYDPKKWPSKDRKLIETHCRRWLARVISDMQPQAIMPLGADATRAVYGRGVKITKVRGVPEYLEEFDTHVVPTFDPIAVHLYPQHVPLFESDCNTFRRLVDSDFNVSAAERKVRGEYEEIEDLQFLIDLKPKVLAFDLETLGMRWAAPEGKILTMQFCTEPGKAYLLSWDHPDNPKTQRQKARLKVQLRELLQNPDIKILGQNLKYDANWTINRLGIRFKISHDTIMLAALVDENAQSIGLDTLAKVYTPAIGGYADHFNKKYDKGRMDLIPLSEIVNYGCGDVDATFRVFEVLYELVKNDSRLLNHYNRVSIPGINAFVSIEQRGLLIDEQALDEFEQVLAAEVEERYQELIKQVPRSIKRKHLALKKEPRKALSFSRREFLIDILFNHPDGFKLKPTVFTKDTANLEDDQKIPSTSSKDHLPYFHDTCVFARQLGEYVKNERVLSTNVRSFRQKYMMGNKIFPTYTLWKTVTGRSASESPNSQNFPKRGKAAKAYRKIFIPPPGYIMLEADLSQAELRISSSMAGEDTMIRIYAEGGDIHRTTACVVLGISEDKFDALPKEERDLSRFKAKAVNFGFIYGMGWRKFIVYAYTQYGVKFTDIEAKRIRDAFFSKYHKLSNWHYKVRKFVHRHGYVRSYSGRIRHLPMINSDDEGIRSEAERQGINSPVQEFASTLGVIAFSRMDQEVDPRFLQVVGFVHDAIYAYVPFEFLEWGAKTLKWYMESTPLYKWFDLRLPVPIIADVSFGINGASMNEMKGLSYKERFDFSGYSEKLGFDLPEQKTPPGKGRLDLPAHLKCYA